MSFIAPMKKILLLGLPAVLAARVAVADIRLANLFTDHAVLQRNTVVPVWGTATDGKTITVSFNGQKVSAVAKDGRWMVRLQPLKAGGPYTLTASGDGMVTVTDILVGDVWLCSGQSNMDKEVGPHKNQPDVDNYQQELAKANHPQIRLFKVPAKEGAVTPQEEVNTAWSLCDSAHVRAFSAAGYFFGRDLQPEIKVPLGLIHSCWGGTAAEYWLDKSVMAADPELRSLVTSYEESMQGYEEKSARLQEALKAAAAAGTTDTASVKAYNQLKLLKRNGGGLYNAMIYPLRNFPITGVIWYQGESNSDRAKQYETLFPALIKNWRDTWHQDLPFLFVQIAPNKSKGPDLREAQFLTWKRVPNTFMAVITDGIDSTFNLHPGNKQLVGARLALAARAMVYREKLEYSGPVYESAIFKGSQAILSFSHTGKGLVAKNGPLTGFTIAGEDKVFVPAKATISGNKLVVTAEGVKRPVAVRFGWTDIPHDNFYNSADLPASPFRTDVD
ncbi:sialate O-acetylesterase [Chitinophaga sp. Cy-1792]|uniref:sialate O-acetylesterase n=1 Tax=Chitinophaga sp. Cy-1792 TaxID=2608339 RepID=UPI00141E88B1|nr:sialate O-acetylesterase [Chitinophaga sp. Cy-1792]NIG56454.1 sialate O-acetylesterase [Chitinophaga sp. Cy-1792]